MITTKFEEVVETVFNRIQSLRPCLNCVLRKWEPKPNLLTLFSFKLLVFQFMLTMKFKSYEESKD